MTDEEVRDRLVAACDDAGSQKAWAEAHGFSKQYVSDVIMGRRTISENLAAALGLRKDWIDVKKGGVE